MYTFGNASSKKLATVHPLLIVVCTRALELSPYDFTIIHGWRGEDVTIRYGGDWDTDGSTKDQSLMDWGHVEILL